MPIKTFRGNLASSGTDTIRLATKRGQIGYRIKKIECITVNPAAYDTENFFHVWTNPNAAIGSIDFSNSELLGINYSTSGNTVTETDNQTIIFDHVVINQDIYISHTDAGGNSQNLNYYMELEQLNLSELEAAVATLKDMRGA